MDKSHIFIVRIRTRQPEHACHVTIREVEAAEATTVPTADELWASMFSVLQPSDARVAAGDSPTSSVIAPCSERPEVRFPSGPLGADASQIRDERDGDGNVSLLPRTASICAGTAVSHLFQ